MYRDSQKRLTGNDVFEGYAIDLIKEVAEILSELSKFYALIPTFFLPESSAVDLSDLKL